MTITEIINALRCCADSSTGCDRCPFVGKCIHTHADLKLTAVDTIQILCDQLATYYGKFIKNEKRIVELEKELAAYKAQRDKQLRESLEKYEKKIEELRAQMSKQDKWMINIRWYQQPTQSATTNVGTVFLCTSTDKLCPNATEYGYCKQTICNNPDARMRVEQK